MYAVREDHEDYYDEGNVIAHNEMLDRLKVFEKNKFIVKDVKCPHNFDHQFMFLYQVKLKEKQNKYELEFQKIGQSPSMSDFARLNLSRHEKLMREFGCFEDFVMATHMNGSGTGVAAYTYLRRVFEKLIYRVFNDKQTVLGKTESDFREMKMKMKNKIILLKDFLPDFLTNNNPNIYGLLSSGIHELSEDEASMMFPVLETAILIIFKEKQAKIDDDILKQKTHNALNNFATEINSK